MTVYHNYNLINKMTTLYLKSIPPDLRIFILKIQLELKCTKGIKKYSQSQAVLHIIKEYKKLIEK